MNTTLPTELRDFINNLPKEPTDICRQCFEWFEKNVAIFPTLIVEFVKDGLSTEEIYSRMFDQLPPTDSHSDIEKHKTIISAIEFGRRTFKASKIEEGWRTPPPGTQIVKNGIVQRGDWFFIRQFAAWSLVPKSAVGEIIENSGNLVARSLAKIKSNQDEIAKK
ncbi:MAG TPA: hypothetical protein VGO57_08510 [Verrucomicrobiae bacterium]|jgi:hypothetical protein